MALLGLQLQPAVDYGGSANYVITTDQNLALAARQKILGTLLIVGVKIDRSKFGLAVGTLP
ncbi:hypothetical protein AYJ01_07495 [Shewanella algae]|nr:hypothetical protein AYJ01_07495 [Shewanella algae]